eukprot:TRINITY_DN89574_c0_g1_i1.p1 TRINITY_DN89574_c0_g1~~TRINITY_DN89574_c0_g1_i1.p1  ORF type:complete len:369 (+),score=48.38 TRINITY_DN89574_c0_g1_i1:858-1964(+)
MGMSLKGIWGNKEHAMTLDRARILECAFTLACLCALPFASLAMLMSLLLIGLPLFALWVLLFVYGHLPASNTETEEPLTRTASFDQALKEQPGAFLSDEAVGGTILYRITKFLNYRLACWFHGFEVKGVENLPLAGKGALLISMHSTHNADILVACTGLHEASGGRAPRGLLHRIVFMLHPYTRYMGMVPGQRYTAKHLIQRGYLTCVLPGGAEEAMTGHDNAYNLHPRWKDRRGFAHVAQDADADIIPVFIKNAEEMRFSPIFYVCNRMGLTRIYTSLVDKRIPVFSWILKQMGLGMWFCLSWLGIPIPVKVTMYIGKPISKRENDFVDDIAERARAALQAMIHEHQPHGHQYLPGLRERFARAKTA